MIAEKPTTTPAVLTLAQGLKSWAADQIARPMVRQFNIANDVEIVGHVANDSAHGERRADERRQSQAGASVELRRWAVGSAADFAVRLVDLSQFGVGVQLNRIVETGDRFEVTLWSPNRDWSIRCMGIVRWCKSNADGIIMAGLRLTRPIALRDLEELV